MFLLTSERSVIQSCMTNRQAGAGTGAEMPTGSRSEKEFITKNPRTFTSVTVNGALTFRVRFPLASI